MRERADPDYKPPKKIVVELTDSTFYQAVTHSKLSLVMFYAPWCGHCKKLLPEYEEAARTLLNEHDIKLYKIDGTVEKTTADKYSVNGWPTLKVNI